MFYIKLVRYYYIFLSILILVAPINVGLIEFIPALIFLWATYFAFNYIIRTSKINYPIANNLIQIISISNKKLLIVTLTFLVFIPIYIEFYTGSSMQIAINRMLSGNFGTDSSYALYQKYFSENNLGQMSIRKLPYIIGYGILRFVFWMLIISIVGYCRKISLIQSLCLVLIVLLYLLQGVTRGTGFETFEMLFIVVYSLLLRFNVLYQSSWLKGKTKYLVYLLIVLGLVFFLINISYRYSGEIVIVNISSSLRFDEESFIAQYMPWLSPILMNLSAYFLFGLYFISTTINEIWLNGTIEGFLSGIIPFGNQVFGFGDNYTQILCGKFINCGVSWPPHAMTIIRYTGIILYFALIGLLGKYSYLCFRKALNGSPRHAVFLFVITYEMFSICVGNFVFVSSGNTIALLILIISKYIKTETFFWKIVKNNE